MPKALKDNERNLRTDPVLEALEDEELIAVVSSRMRKKQRKTISMADAMRCLHLTEEDVAKADVIIEP